MRNMFGNEIDNKKFVEVFREILLPLFLYLFVYFLADMLLIVLTTWVNNLSANAGGFLSDFFSKYDATVHGVVGGIAMLIGAAPLFSSFSKEREEERRKGEGRIAPFRLLLTLLLAISVSLAINILFIKAGFTENSDSYSQTAERQYSVVFFVGILLYGIISPLAEEIVFRGIIYNRLKKHFRIPLFSMVLSAMLFGIYHGNFVQAAYGFGVGMLIAYTYEAFGSFFYAFLFHAAANVTVYTVTGSSRLYGIVMKIPVGIVCGCIAILILFGIEKSCCSRRQRVR